jgi:succinate dehydrogenase/fumarate reductase flavoprotein subunit
LYQTPGKQLITNDKGEVIGIYADSKGQQIAIKAKRAVVLTTGGYENDPSMLKSHTMGWPIYFLGTPGDTGDGIRMAEKVGAAIWHMNGLSCPLGFKAPEFEGAFMASVPGASYVYVNRYGKRFVNEKGPEGHAWYLAVNSFNDETLNFPAIPCYAIFDEKVRTAGAVANSTMGYVRGKYNWSKDNSDVIKKGWIVKADTIKSLATALKMDPAVLDASVAKWNADAKAGQDTLYNRPIKAADATQPPVSAPLETPPFYAIEFNPTLLNTQGGPRRNTKAQIVDPFGVPISRLYSAGELGCMWGIVYQGSGNIGECFSYGRIAGRNAAAEKPWDAAV